VTLSTRIPVLNTRILGALIAISAENLMPAFPAQNGAEVSPQVGNPESSVTCCHSPGDKSTARMTTETGRQWRKNNAMNPG
jgi:hypothetical protein